MRMAAGDGKRSQGRKRGAAIDDGTKSFSRSLRSEDGALRGEAISVAEASSSSTNHTIIEESILAAAETKQLHKVRFLVVVVLIFAVACAIGVYFYVRNQEQQDFEAQFQDDAVKIMASLSHSIDSTIAGINALSVSLVSHAKATNQTWPLVTIPDFDVRAGKFLSLSNAYVINTYIYVKGEERAKWENYTATHNDWVDQALDVQEGSPLFKGPIIRNYTVKNVIYGYGETGETGTNRSGPYLPWWQSYPVIPIYWPYNWDMMSWPSMEVTSVMETHQAVLGAAYLITYGNNSFVDELNDSEVEFAANYIDPEEEPKEPVSDILYPIIAESTEAFDLWNDYRLGTYDPEKFTFVGMLSMSFYWRDMLRDILPPGSNGIDVVLSNGCGTPTFTYRFMGPEVVYLGAGDHTDRKYRYIAMKSSLLDLAEFALRDSGYSGAPLNQDVCPYKVKVSPSTIMESDYTTSNPIIFSATAGIIFLLFAAMFYCFDVIVERRQRLLMIRAKHSSAIISSIIPDDVAFRLFTAVEDTDADATPQEERGLLPSVPSSRSASARTNVLAFLENPITETFVSTTIMVCDIPEFSVWTQKRDPAQVFELLEAVFRSFDELARRRKVYKIESCLDRYIAASGVPHQQTRHAEIMAGFAWDCLTKFAHACSSREGCSELGLRIGLHSGAVTAGLMRVDRARYQVFGETVSIAAQMASAGSRNRIHVSNSTANYLIASGKKHWLTRIDDPVVAKSINLVATYWLIPRNQQAALLSRNQSIVVYELPVEVSNATDETKHARLVDTMVKLLLEHIQRVVTWYGGISLTKQEQPEARNRCRTLLEDAKCAVKFPNHAPMEASAQGASPTVSSTVVEQLERFVSDVASSYRDDNAFHNFEHACVTVLAVDRYLKRIVNVEVVHEQTWEERLSNVVADYTGRITSDPLVMLAMVFAALFHDAGNSGFLSNAQLCIEDEQLAERFQHQSVAQQRAVELSWEILMREEYELLRACMFPNSDEFGRFRHVVVTSVLATDIFDEQLSEDRKNRWEKAFSLGGSGDVEKSLDVRAAIVMEHIMQAAVFSHTLQDWETYRLWSQRLFEELKCAFRTGRMDSDPALLFYQSELELFDEYIIPLAGRIKRCNVFGVSSDECLMNAMRNRSEWEQCGKALVAEMT